MQRNLKCLIPCLAAVLISFPGHSQSKSDLIDSLRKSVVRVHSFTMPYQFDNLNYVTGTGYVADTEGLIITNNHVIANCNGILIYSEFSDKPYYATILYQDSILDLAVLKAYDCKLPALAFAEPDQVRQGEETLIFGYPGYSYKDEKLKVSWGIISSSCNDSTIQTTAAVNPGNSGGPAVDMLGRVIGTVYEKSVGISIEGQGFVRNVLYTRNALARARMELYKTQKYFGTVSFEAYKHICDAAVMGWEAEKETDKYKKESILNNSKNNILAALDEDVNYGDAYYFLAAFYLKQMLIFCLDEKENDGADAKTKFIAAFDQAKAKKPSYAFQENTVSIFSKAFKEGDINCSDFRNYTQAYVESELFQQRRTEELENYIRTGETPQILKEVLGVKEKQTVIITPPSVTNTPVVNANPPAVSSGAKKFFQMNYFDKNNPVQLSVNLPDGINNYTSNIGFSMGNSGDPESDNIVQFKHQVSFNLFQRLNDESKINQSLSIFSYNLGLRVKPFRDSRFNIKPYITVGWNPIQEKISMTDSTEITSNTKWYWDNTAANFGFDVDVWLTRYFGLVFSYEYTSNLANRLQSLYEKESALFFDYQAWKIGIIF